jgi:hypothetical protein
MRLVTAAQTWSGSSYTVFSTPSIRKRTTPISRRGSMWMSLARCSKAYCSSQSTMLTMCWSLASGSRLEPSSSICSRLPIGRPAPAPAARAPRTEPAMV